ncbi:uncharacterized protein SPPG_03174 [Spizellomyces punctatus DAOM BR117]|uniref:Uncharacterized protein n=1 Tax=Spizellomyces punctatus (strain DAOM BR117) TaxID=645134 RepID=A0A0L0HIS5_SPIPD|nr:uncharacterized protein SPPG_03174 [Spizellomyces punctatus DAOM BR117]KND01361.1 hypothetical protein SPPG_03174 [Spizellomyces punctatus DAOM BR117]|eukprot:XP_016609400.1 hypothetical protein SPPG_03174 [Spizellomyces punctatus DAOM BR117]
MSTSVPDTKVDNASLQNIFLSNRPTSNNEEDDAWDDVELPDDGLGNDIFAEAPPDELFDGMGWDEDPVLALDDLGGSVESGVGDIKMETDESKSGKECDSVTGTGRTGEDLEDLDLDLETLEIPVAQSETQRHELGGADAFGEQVQGAYADSGVGGDDV